MTRIRRCSAVAMRAAALTLIVLPASPASAYPAQGSQRQLGIPAYVLPEEARSAAPGLETPPVLLVQSNDAKPPRTKGMGDVPRVALPLTPSGSGRMLTDRTLTDRTPTNTPSDNRGAAATGGSLSPSVSAQPNPAIDRCIVSLGACQVSPGPQGTSCFCLTSSGDMHWGQRH